MKEYWAGEKFRVSSVCCLSKICGCITWKLKAHCYFWLFHLDKDTAATGLREIMTGVPVPATHGEHPQPAWGWKGRSRTTRGTCSPSEMLQCGSWGHHPVILNVHPLLDCLHFAFLWAGGTRRPVLPHGQGWSCFCLQHPAPAGVQPGLTQPPLVAFGHGMQRARPRI